MFIPCSLPMVALLPHIRPGLKAQDGLWAGYTGNNPTLAYRDDETGDIVVLSIADKARGS